MERCPRPLGAVDNSLSRARRCAICSQDPQILLNTSTAGVELGGFGSYEQIAGR